MTNVWLYHINPESPEGYSYPWRTYEPKKVFAAKGKIWSAPQMWKQISVDDLICVFLKKMKVKSDGVYIVGVVTAVNESKRQFTWRPDQQRSAKLLIAPVTPDVVRACFGRSYGAGIQRLPSNTRARWLAEIRPRGQIFDGVPVVIVKSKLSGEIKSDYPFASKKNGTFGEEYVLKLLRKRHTRASGFEVTHVAKLKPSSDHDISVSKNGKVVQFVEVKTRLGSPNDPVLISENELRCRRRHGGKHTIFIVYLRSAGRPHSLLEIQTKDAFALSPRQHWLKPGSP
jgi:hypothetical protein